MISENNVICSFFYLKKNLQHVLSLTTPEAWKARNDLNLLEGSRVEIIEKIHYTLIDTNSAIDDGCVLHIEKQHSIDDDDSN